MGRKNGAGDGIRTRDIQLGKLTLYQLSYTRIWQDGLLSRFSGIFARGFNLWKNSFLAAPTENIFTTSTLKR